MKRAYKQGKFDEKRLAHSVKKILKAKYKVGLAKPHKINTENIIEEVNTPLDDFLIHRAMAEAMTLIEDKGILPLPEKEIIGFLTLGDDNGDVFHESLAKERIFQRLTFTGETSAVVEAAKNLSTIVVGFHRSNDNPWKAADFSAIERTLLSMLTKTHKVILVPFVKPYALSKLENLQEFEALLLGYQNNKEAQQHAARILVGKQGVHGKLPVSIHPNFPAGRGIVRNIPLNVLEKEEDPFQVGD